ncbi:MAG: TetR family transcriptional regulator [Hyphomicrobiales bacterium]
MAKRVLIEDIRRQELTLAGLEVLMEGGPDGATMERIGARAGMSRGIVNYYFKSKDELIVEVVKRAFFDSGVRCAHLQETVATARERLKVIVQVKLRDFMVTPEVARSWIATFSRYASHPEFQLAQLGFDQKTLADLKSELSSLVRRESLDITAKLVLSQIKGLWLERALVGYRQSCTDAIAEVEALIDLAIAADPYSPS